MAIQTTLVRRDFALGQDDPRFPWYDQTSRTIGSPYVDHNTKTITFPTFTSFSSPALGQLSAQISAATESRLAFARQQTTALKGPISGTVIGNTQPNAFAAMYARNPWYTPGSSGSQTSILHLMANDYGRTLDWANANISGRNIKMDMGGQPHYRSIDERYSGYDADLVSRYKAGQASHHDMFYNQMYRNVHDDRDEIGSPFNYTKGLNAYARARVTFGNTSGRVSFSGSFGSGGTSYKYY